jgi:hypothetical protein
MSINSLTNSAAARRSDFAPLNALPSNYSEIALAAVGMPASDAGGASQGKSTTAPNSVNTAMQVLFGYIPTEVLTLYVAVVAAIHPSVTPPADSKVPQAAPITSVDWATLYIFLVATPIILWIVYATKLKAAEKPLPVALSSWPVWEMFAATVAYSAWAFALPGTPFRKFSWYSAGLAGVAVLVVSTVLGLLAPLFQKKLGP